MKKTFTLLMALALVTSLFAVPVNPQLKQQGKKAQTEQKVMERTHVMPQINLTKVQDLARPEVRKAPMAKKNINRNAVRKAVQASTFSFVSSTPAGWTVNPTPYGYETKDPARGMQMTATTTITYAGAEDVSSITVTGSTNGAGNTISVKVGTTDFGSTTLAKGDRHKEYKFSGTKSSGNVVITVTRAASSIWIESVSLDGTGGGGGGEGGDTITLNTMEYVDAYYSEGYWDFDMYVDYDYESYELTYPEFYFSCDEEATSQTAISGEWTMYYGGVWNNKNDSVEMSAGNLSVTVNADKTYNFYGQFTGDDDNVYVVDLKNIEVYAYDADNDYEEIELDEEGGTPTEVDTVLIPVNYVQAMRYDSYSELGANLWEVDAINYKSESDQESLWFMITTPQPDRLVGTYDIESGNIYNYYGYYYYAGYNKVNGTDTTSVWAGTENIQLTILYDESSKQYGLYGELLSEDSKTLYQISVDAMDIVAFNEEEKDVILVDSIEFVPDTIDLTGMDAIEYSYYASYSEEGNYCYLASLYNASDIYPYLSINIYTETKDEFVGSYTETNVGFGTYYPNEDSYDGCDMTNSVFTITKEGDVYTIEGSFVGADGNYYRFSVSAEATMADGDYPYEPMEKQDDINIVANSKDMLTDYVSDYNLLYMFMNSETDTIQLSIYTSKTTIADGTYAISTAEEPNDGELIAGYYYQGIDGCVAFVGNSDAYYLVDGDLTVATANDTTTYTLGATSAHGTVVNAIFKEYKAGPTPGEHTIVFADYCTEKTDTAFTTTDGIYSVVARKNGGQTAPFYSPENKDFRIYAKGTFEISAASEMTEIVFNISKAGMKRQAEITPSTGNMTYNLTDSIVTWTGKASNIVFTVGEKNKYGSDETTKAGQFCFTSLDIKLVGTGLMEAMESKSQNLKFFYDGQLFILKNGILYNAQGQVIK